MSALQPLHHLADLSVRVSASPPAEDDAAAAAMLTCTTCRGWESALIGGRVCSIGGDVKNVTACAVVFQHRSLSTTNECWRADGGRWRRTNAAWWEAGGKEA